MRSFFLLCLFSACVPAEEAPEELADLSRFLYLNFDGDQDLVADGAGNLADLLVSEFDLDAQDFADRQVAQPPLREEDLGSANLTDEFDPETQDRVAVVFRSELSMAEHLDAVLIEDQGPMEPSASAYDRTFVDDPGCWSDGDCALFRTTNYIVKDNALYTVPYDTRKHFRPLTLEDGRSAMLARVDIAEAGVSADGRASIDQSFSMDLWVEDPEDAAHTVRIMFVWSSVTIHGLDMEAINIDGIIGDGIEDTFVAHDAYLSER